MAASSWATMEEGDGQKLNESLKKFFDYFEQKSPKIDLSPGCKVTPNFIESSTPEKQNGHSTNPFLHPYEASANTPSNTKSFFADMLAAEDDLITFDDPPPKVRSNNPFLDPIDGSPSEKRLSALSDVSAFINQEHSDLSNDMSKEQSSNVLSESSFVNESSLRTSNECEIPAYFDRGQWKEGDFITFRVGNIYHPNKFWVVPRYRELEILMEHLEEFYSKNKRGFRVKKPSVNLYSVVHHNDVFYRAIIVRFLPNDPYRLKVFLFDYGMIRVVDRSDVYYMRDGLYKVPAFAVRASLAYVAPKRTQVWTSEVVEMFDEFTSGKVLIGEIVHADDELKYLELNLADMPTEGSKVKYFNESLMDEGYAKFNFDMTEPIHKQFVSKVPHLYVFPTFRMLETGGVPSNVYQFEALTANVTAFNIVYGRYCSLK